eukprot:m.24039 g.24039  ORF g.24039 m.24039 type:complete len:218 (+) comp11468_c0_seq1:208-861(+)
MSVIVYSLVARGHLVLAEYTDLSGNFPTVTQGVLDKLQPQEGRRSFQLNEYCYHIDQHDGFTFLCLANPGSSAKVAFTMLSRMGDAFMAECAEKGQTAHAYSLESAFGPVLRREMAWANQANNDTALMRAQAQVNEVKEVMVENIDKVLQRGDRIDLLVDKADALELEAGRFKKNATKLKKRMWWKDFKCKLLMIFLVLLALLLIILAATGKLGKKK